MSQKSELAISKRMLDVIEGDIFPITQKAVQKGNKIFGRGATDDKGELITRIKDVNACLKTTMMFLTT